MEVDKNYAAALARDVRMPGVAIQKAGVPFFIGIGNPFDFICQLTVKHIHQLKMVVLVQGGVVGLVIAAHGAGIDCGVQELPCFFIPDFIEQGQRRYNCQMIRRGGPVIMDQHIHGLLGGNGSFFLFFHRFSCEMCVRKQLGFGRSMGAGNGNRTFRSSHGLLYNSCK